MTSTIIINCIIIASVIITSISIIKNVVIISNNIIMSLRPQLIINPHDLDLKSGQAIRLQSSEVTICGICIIYRGRVIATVNIIIIIIIIIIAIFVLFIIITLFILLIRINVITFFITKIHGMAHFNNIHKEIWIVCENSKKNDRGNCTK